MEPALLEVMNDFTDKEVFITFLEKVGIKHYVQPGYQTNRVVNLANEVFVTFDKAGKFVTFHH